MTWKVVPGKFDIMIGKSSIEIVATKTLDVSGE